MPIKIAYYIYVYIYIQFTYYIDCWHQLSSNKAFSGVTTQTTILPLVVNCIGIYAKTFLSMPSEAIYMPSVVKTSVEVPPRALRGVNRFIGNHEILANA